MKQKRYFSIFFPDFLEGEGYNIAKFSNFQGKILCEHWSEKKAVYSQLKINQSYHNKTLYGCITGGKLKFFRKI